MYEVVDKIGIVSEGSNGWNKELNLISWNDREPVYDLRTWSPDHEKMGKGVTITVAEAKVLRDMLYSAHNTIYDLQSEVLRLKSLLVKNGIQFE